LRGSGLEEDYPPMPEGKHEWPKEDLAGIRIFEFWFVYWLKRRVLDDSMLGRGEWLVRHREKKWLTEMISRNVNHLLLRAQRKVGKLIEKKSPTRQRRWSTFISVSWQMGREFHTHIKRRHKILRSFVLVTSKKLGMRKLAKVVGEKITGGEIFTERS
jgi:hypothetical protein